MNSDFEKILARFVADGNVVEGNVPKSAELPQMSWTGSGNTLKFGDDVLIRDLRLSFEAGGTIWFRKKSKPRGHFRVDGNGRIRVGGGTNFNRPCYVIATAKTSVTIGIQCLFSNVSIRTSDMHSIFDANGVLLNPDRSIIIGDQVWLAENVGLHKGVIIGSGSVIGANSLVTKDIPEKSLAVGSPARVVKSNISWNRKQPGA